MYKRQAQADIENFRDWTKSYFDQIAKQFEEISGTPILEVKPSSAEVTSDSMKDQSSLETKVNELEKKLKRIESSVQYAQFLSRSSKGSEDSKPKKYPFASEDPSTEVL